MKCILDISLLLAPDPNTAEFLMLINAHQAMLRRICRLYCPDADDQQDLFQEIVLQLWRAFPRYEPRGAKISTWMYRIGLNVAVSDLRHRTRKPTPDRLNPQIIEVAQASDLGTDTTETAALYRAIEWLSEVEKAFVLLYLEEHTYEEMADILGITQNNVRVKMHRIQEKLRRIFSRSAQWN
ncbi:RNA polymerase, sigma-24 subunit, ECF subfamily [Hymenobacter roseosalivarius DSM 11622]|uniref:RNA polymerase, sigma-24 subunit, ECF subfamily n=1 Tax=Hymenobacter roseosalivarius DSM 11622 TaxID=645990 RepID=A0A1W1V8I8_9BACT|nr:sigma-70 family RNA polymerase sigma factor [Hymenobacter roseosalivarius]SMB89678.1 RNA polymerase, sigma-24 subunit, ECF subfamily [Hymenobacter roseosalivarius DSM 11622]